MTEPERCRYCDAEEALTHEATTVNRDGALWHRTHPDVIDMPDVRCTATPASKPTTEPHSGVSREQLTWEALDRARKELLSARQLIPDRFDAAYDKMCEAHVLLGEATTALLDGLSPASGDTAPETPSGDVEAMRRIMDEAREAVRPVIERERAGTEGLWPDIRFRSEGMTPDETFTWLVERSNRLAELESTAPETPTGAASEDVLPVFTMTQVQICPVHGINAGDGPCAECGCATDVMVSEESAAEAVKFYGQWFAEKMDARVAEAVRDFAATVKHPETAELWLINRSRGKEKS